MSVVTAFPQGLVTPVPGDWQGVTGDRVSRSDCFMIKQGNRKKSLHHLTRMDMPCSVSYLLGVLFLFMLLMAWGT